MVATDAEGALAAADAAAEELPQPLPDATGAESDDVVDMPDTGNSKAASTAPAAPALAHPAGGPPAGWAPPVFGTVPPPVFGTAAPQGPGGNASAPWPSAPWPPAAAPVGGGAIFPCTPVGDGVVFGKGGGKAAPSEPARPGALESAALKARLDAIREELEKDEGKGFASKAVVENVRSKVDDAVRVLEAMRLLEVTEQQDAIFVRTATAAFELYEETYVKARLVWRENLEKALRLRDFFGVTGAFAPYTSRTKQRYTAGSVRTKALVRSEFIDCVELSFYSACKAGDLKALDFVLSPPDFGEDWKGYMNAAYHYRDCEHSLKVSSYPLQNKSLLGGPSRLNGHTSAQEWLNVLGEPNSDFAKQLRKGLRLAIEHGQVFVVARIKEKVQHVITRKDQTWWDDTDAYALAFKLKKRWILPLFAPAVAGRDLKWYRMCSKIMTVQEFVEASEAEEEPCSTALRHELAESTRAKEALQHELAESTRAKAALQEAQSGQGSGCDQGEAERAAGAAQATRDEVPPPSLQE